MLMDSTTARDGRRSNIFLAPRQFRICGQVCLLCTLLIADSAVADVFRFKDGRIIEGKVEDVKEEDVDGTAITVWLVQVAEQDFVLIRESDLTYNGHEPPSKNELEYLERLKENPPQTADDHCAIAGWCHNRLPALALAHYERALDLDPNHGVARAGAGYMRDQDGRWQPSKKIMGDKRGKVRYKNRWRFPEDVDIEQHLEQEDAAIAPIKKQMNTWHSNASFGRTDRMRSDAIANLRQIQDPREAQLLAEYFLEQHRQVPPKQIRMLYIGIMSRFPNTIPALTQAALTDNDPDIRNSSLDALRQMGAQAAVPTFISYLQNANNSVVQNAALALDQFDPPNAVLDLIYALNTTHQVEEGQENSNYNPGRLVLGNSKKTVSKSFQNPAVLNVLRDVTNQDFGYDENRWLAWYAQQYAPPVRDLRRDP